MTTTSAKKANEPPPTAVSERTLSHFAAEYRRDAEGPTAYCVDVLQGRRPAGDLIKQCVARHINDIFRTDDSGIYFDSTAGMRAIDFFKFIRHSKGEWAGQPFTPSDWQQFILWNLFGWMRADGTRRYRVAYIEIPRKNGKSTMLAGIGLYLFVADGERGAEIYSAATKRDQARIIHGEAVRMVQQSPELRKLVAVFRDNLNIPATNSKFEPLSSDQNTLDGLNVHAGLVDELHAHRTREVWDLIDTATGARRQPLLFAITTAGTDQTSICFEQHEYSRSVLSGTVRDDSHFAFIATIDEGDDWRDPAVWAKANPNYGVSVKHDNLREQCEKAQKIPAQQNTFLRLRLNVWTQQTTRWIDLATWDDNETRDAVGIDDVALAGRPCHGAIDLSSASDMTVWMLLFPRDGDPEHVDILPRIFCPESMLVGDHKYADQYLAWAHEGWLITTPGSAIDYEAIKAQVLLDAETFGIIDINFDRWQAVRLIQELEEEFRGRPELTTVGMGFASMAMPCIEFERRLLERKIHHGNHPVLRWMAEGVCVKTDPAGNMKPDKANSQRKIDGIVTLLMCLDRQMRNMSGEGGKSVYEGGGVKFI